MADFEKVQLQVEVVRTQLDSLIKDVNNLKAQKLNFTVDSSGLDAINRFNSSVQAMTQNVDGLSGKFTRIWAGAADGAPTRTIETVNEGLGRTTEIIRTLDEETQQYTTVQTKATTNYDEMAKAAQKAAEKAEKAAKEQAKETENAASKVDTLRKGFADLGLQMKSAAEKYPAGTFSDIESDAKQASAALENLYSSWKSGAISDQEFVAGVKDASSSLKNLRANYAQTRNETDKLTNSTNVLGDTFSHIVGKITVWQVVNAAVAKVKRSFTEAIDTMKQVDTEMTAIQKVTGNTAAEMEKLGNTAYEAASKYGVAVTDYLESVGTFAKAGYKEMSEDMAELATKTQLVGDVNADTANKFLLSADAAFKFEGNVTALNTVLDKANEIENNYATSIQKMAEGFPIVANVASMANMSIDQLIAMLGTITAVTQESGPKAATAARALILNIIGDTETELEDGITWTKEEIESLNQVLWTYSEEAMKAAQATGRIVNPMEAVAGLAKAYKEGVLTQAELAQIESDLGGKLRTNQLDALIKNYDMYAAMLDKVANSAGSADKEVDVMLTSWDAKAKILNNTWTKFIADTVDTKWAKGFLDTLTWLIEGFGNLGTAVTIFGGVLVAFKWNSIVGSFKTLGSVIGALPMLFSSAKGGAAGFDAGMKALNVSLTSTQLLVGTIVVALSALVIAYNKYTQKIQETRQAAIDAGEAATKESEEITSLYGEYKEYNDALKDSAEYKGEISGKTETLIEKLGLERDEVEKLVRKYGDLETAINKAAEAKLSSNLYDAKAATSAAKANLEDQFQAMYVGSERVDAEEIIDLYDDLVEQRNKMIDSGQQESYMYKVTAERIETLKPLVESYTQSKQNELEIENQIKAAKNGTLDLYGKEESELNDVSDSANDAADALSDVEAATYDANTAAAKLTKSLFDANGKLTEHAKKALTTNTALADLAKKELELQHAAAEANYNNLIAQIQAVGSSAIITSQQIQQMIGLIPGLTSNTWSAENQEFNMRRLFNQQTGKNWRKDAEDYAQWSSQYLLKKSSEYYKKQQEEYKQQMESLSKYTSDYTGASSGGGGSSSDANLEAHKQKVELLKSELTLLEKQNASEDTQKDKMRQIQQALHAQAQYLRSIGGSQSDINALSAEWWEWQEKINGSLKSTDDLLNELQGVMSDKLSDLSDQRQNELDAIDAQIDALKQQKDTRDEQLDLEEKILAVQQAQAKIANAQNERTVRQYNARTGQWEWVADQKEVDSAQKALDEAKKDLEDFKANMAYEAALAELEAKKDAINAQYDALEKNYNNFLKSLKEKTRGIGEILQDIWKNATPELRQIIQENAELFRQFGFDVSQLSDAVKETAKKLYGVSANGARYEIGSDRGIDFVNNAKPGESIIGGDGSTWTKNEDGTVTIVDKNGISYVVNPGNGTGDSSGGSNAGPKYSGTVWAIRLDGKGENYKISSANGLNFLNNALAGEELNGGDGSHWVKNADGTTSITDKYGIAYKVYDQGGILRGMGGIKATTQDEGITPPDVTAMLKKRVLTPVEDRNFSQNMDSIRWMMSSNGVDANAVHNASYDNHSIGTQNNGNVYKFNGITINEPQASGMTLKQFADIAHNLGNFS